MRKQQTHLIILIAYTLIALVMTSPLAANFATAIPGVEGDAPSFVWALGWMKRALELGANPFHTDYVFYPLGGATQLLWAVSLIGILSLPLQYAFGLVAAHNVMYLAATVLTAYGMYLLAHDALAHSQFAIRNSQFAAGSLPPFQTFLLFKFVTEQRRLATRHSPLAAFTAGLIFAFAPLRLGYGLAFFNLYNTQFIPFYVLFLMRATRARSRRDAILAGLFLGLNAYVDFQIAAFLVLFTGLYLVFVAAYLFAQPLSTAKAVTTNVVITALISIGIVAPMLALLANDFAIEGGNYIRVFPIKYSTERSYDVLAYVAPHAQSALYAHVPLKIAGVNAGVNASDGSAFSPDRQSFVGYVVLALAAYAAARQWQRARFWLCAAILFALFSLGPSLHFLGRDTGIPLPFLALHEIPIVNHIRIPMRYGIVVAFALAMLAAIAVNDLGFRISDFRLKHHVSRFTFHASRFAYLLLPAFILLESAFFPYPIQPLAIPRIYSEIARVPGDFTILEIPTFNWRAASAFEAYQAIHGKRILRAYTNRIAPDVAEYFAYRGTPIVTRSLRVLEGAEKGPLDPADIAEDRRVRDEVLRFFDLRYAVVHRQFLSDKQTRDIDAYLRNVLDAKIVDDDGTTISYRFPSVPSSSLDLHIDLREPIGQLYAGRGWQFEYPKANWEGEFDFVWARGTQSEIYFVADETRERAMTIHAYAASPTRVSISLNGERVSEIALTSAWQDHRITLPMRALKSRMNVVRLEFGAELKETVGVTTIVVQ